MMHAIKQLCQRLLLILLPFWLTPVLSAENAKSSANAEDPDAQKPIEIKADQLQFSNKQGKSIYIGHVVITQGSMELKGDKVILFHPQQKIQKVEVLGQLAQFKKYLAADKKWIQGHAQTIIYWAQNSKIRLTGQAFLQQGEDNQISGPELIYDLKQQTLQAQPTRTEKSRIHVIIQPQPVEKP